MATKQLLLLWETANWVDLERILKTGKLPNFQAFCNKGSAGRLTIVHPLSKIANAVSLASGLPPCDHKIFSSLQASNDTLRESNSSDWTPLWNTLSEHGLRCISINWPLTHPATQNHSSIISDRFFWSGRHHYRHCTPADSVSPAVNSDTLKRINASRIQPQELGSDVLEEFLEQDLSDPEIAPNVPKIQTLLSRIYSIHATSLEMLLSDTWDQSFIRFTGLAEALLLIENSVLKAKHRDKVYHIFDQLLGVTLSQLENRFNSNINFHIVSSLSFTSDQPTIAQGIGIWALNSQSLTNNQRIIHGAHVLDIAPTLLRLAGVTTEELPHSPRTDLFKNLPPLLKKQPLQPRSPNPSPQSALKFTPPWSHLLEDGRVCRLLSPQQKFDLTLIKQTQREMLHGCFSSLMQQQRYTEASDYGKNMMEQFPNSPSVQINYAYCLLAEKKIQPLKNHLSKIDLESSSESFKIEINLLSSRYFLAIKEPENAGNLLLEISNNSHLSSQQKLKLAGIYRDIKDFEAASSIYQSLIQENPKWILPYILLSQLMLKKRDYSGAERAANSALEIDSTNEQAQYNLATARLRQGKKALAQAGINKFIQLTGGTRKINRLLKFSQ